MGQKTLDNEHMPLLCRDVEGGSSVLALDVDDDAVSLQQLDHHHALALVGRHTQWRLTKLVELVRILADCGQVVDHVGVPAAAIHYRLR